MVSDELRDTKEELTQVRQENVETKASLAKIEMLTNNAVQYSFCECLELHVELHEIPTSIRHQDLGEKGGQIFLKKSILPSATDSKRKLTLLSNSKSANKDMKLWSI